MSYKTHSMGEWDEQWRALLGWAEEVMINSQDLVVRKNAYAMLKLITMMYEDYTYD